MTVAAPRLVASRIDGPLLIAAAACTVARLTMQSELLEVGAEHVGAAEEVDFGATMRDEPAV